MKDPIIKLSRKKTFSELAEIPVSSFREIGQTILDKLDTANSFMYLFRRFGTPTFTNSDEYKILYEYRLKYKEIMVAIHASYYEHVYFNAWMPKKYETERVEEYKAHAIQIATESVKKGICYMPYTSTSVDIFPEELVAEHNKIFDAEARKHFSPEDYDFLDNFQCADNDLEGFQPYYQKMEPFRRMLCEKFRATLSEEDLQMYNNGWYINHYPDIKQQVEEFFTELLQGLYVRDVAINIRGYESKENVVLFKEEDEEKDGDKPT